MSEHVLDRPVWNALSGMQTEHSVGGAGARRFHPDIGPLTGIRDDSTESLTALVELTPATGTLLLLQGDPIALPDELEAITEVPGVQMVSARGIEHPHHAEIAPLTDADVPAMFELATMTKPGPFGPRTAELGPFWGVKREGRLAAMAGERMRHPGFIEVSGVCTHPDFRGQGLARALSATVAAEIMARGATPYLHAYASNAGAIALYESLGFELRRSMHVATVKRRGA